MKKSLLALAVIGSFAAAAQAQNVQLYGTIDASIDQSETKVGGVETKATRQGNSDHFATSRLGIRGSEDLGKGLKASFMLEGDLNVNNGSGDGGAATVDRAGLTFDRHSWIAVGYDQATVKIGRSDDLAKRLTKYTFDANMFDPVSLSGDTISASSFAFVKDRNPNSVFVDGKVAGLTYGIAYSNSLAGNPGGAPGAANQDSSRGSVAAEYNFGPVSVGAAYFEAALDATGTAAATAKRSADGYLVGVKGSLFGAQLGAMYYSDKDWAGVNTDETAYQLSAVYPLGMGFKVEANYFDAETEVGTAKTDKQAYGLVISKAFTKRTGAYVGFRESERGTAEQTLFVIGANHSF